MLKDERMDMKVVKYSVAFLNNQVEMSSSTYLNIPSASLLETVTRVDKTCRREAFLSSTIVPSKK
jgi:hypothetical protein